MRETTSSTFRSLLIALALLAPLSACNGPEDVPEQDFVFTDQSMDLANDLASDAQNEAGITGSGSELPYLAPIAETGSGSDELVLDLSQLGAYASIRQGTQAAGQNLYRVTNDFVNVRKEPNVKSANLARVNFGESVTVVEFANSEWAKVKLSTGTEGYAVIRYLARTVGDEMATAELARYAGQYFVSYQFVNVRRAPDQKSEKVGEIPGKTILTPSSIADGWAKVSWNGIEGYVSSGYLTKFVPPIVIRQNTFDLPVLQYRLSEGQEATMLDALKAHVNALKTAGYTFITLEDFGDLLLAQQARDIRLPEKRVVVAIGGVVKSNVKQVSDLLNELGIDATLLLETHNVGLSGITEKQLKTLIANGFEIASATHTGDDLRPLTNAQVSLELKQSRKILEDMTGHTVYSVGFPQGGTNERISSLAGEAGYLLGLSGASGHQFTRDQLLSMPVVQVFSSMTGDDIMRLVQP